MLTPLLLVLGLMLISVMSMQAAAVATYLIVLTVKRVKNESVKVSNVYGGLTQDR